MPTYQYTAISQQGRSIKGVITAANEVDLQERLRNIGLDLTFFKEKKEGRLAFGNALNIKDLIMVCIHMEQLERAGVPVLETIADLRDSADSPHLKNLMADIYEAIRGGKVLSAAMAEHPETFNPVFTGLVAAGEKTGNLAEVFGHLAHHLKWVAEIRRKIKKATIYPIFLMLIMLAVISVMMLYVIPQLSEFLEQQNIKLPIYTRALIATSHFFKDYWYIMLFTPIFMTITIILMNRFSETSAYYSDLIKLQIPFVGRTIRKIEIARFTHFFAITFRSGIDILECLSIGQNVVHNRVIKESISLVRKSVSEGNSLTNSLRLSNQFPSLVIRMFKVGEETGNLDDSLENVNFFYDQEVSDAVNSMIGIVQPALTVVLGGIMMWVTISVFGPLYNSFSTMKF